ncbi:P-type ATpase3 [Cryptosporidium sp. chipmunk genotype I]|uniref:P-type ATpase3 n=1 Tax=Cryptosporidium sp. chipmunk genotype I TaxID=1280935 RepID=UPI003519F463|nr:P-type ATpase3 [Cryptosporidium sp. chipmunk genotype I]
MVNSGGFKAKCLPRFTKLIFRVLTDLSKMKFHSPADPIISSKLGWIAFISLLVSAVLAYCWSLYRNKSVTKQERSDGLQIGYEYSVIGMFLWLIVLFSTILPFLFIIVHTYDTAGCNRRELAPYWNDRALVFISLWLECFFLCFLYRSTRSTFEQFFYFPCDLEVADFVSIWQKISTDSDVTCRRQTKLNKVLSLFLDPFNKLSRILNDEISGYILSTVPVYREYDNNTASKPYFELFCVRYWYSENLKRFTCMEDQKCSNGELTNLTAYLENDIYSIQNVSELEQLKPNLENLKTLKKLEGFESVPKEVEDETRILSPILGLSSELVHEQHHSYGKNEINIKMPSLISGLFNEMMDPLTVFQLLVVASYTFQGYVLFAIKWVPMMIISIIANIRIHFINIRNVKKLAEVTGCDNVKVIRDGKLVTLDNSELVPGDIIHVYENSIVPCDLLLLSGSAVVNESMLTGESAEVLKMPISECESEKISPEDGPYSGKRYFLYAGTQVTAVYNNVGKGMALGSSIGSLNIQTSSTRSTDSIVNLSADLPELSANQKLISDELSTTTALVIRTGISTLRGKIIRSILYPSKYSFGLYDQLPIAWLCLSIIVAFIIFKQGSSFNWGLFTFFFALGSMNSTFPLYLGVLNTLSQNISSMRLLKNFNVKALIPTRIILAGKLRIVCFDKTGTLTNDRLDFIGMSPISINNGDDQTYVLSTDITATELSTDYSIDLTSHGTKVQSVDYVLSDKVYTIDEIQDKFKLAFLSIRSCTSLSHSPTNFGISRDVISNPREYYEKMNGNDTDKALFSVTNSFFEKNSTNDSVYIQSIYSGHDGEKKLDIAKSSLEVLRIFPFDYNKRLMSVIVHCKHNDEYYLFTKGAPESIQKIYTGSIGTEFKQKLDELSSQGYYLIMSGYKRIERSLLNLYLALNRNDIETDLSPIGLLLFENTVRKEAPTVLKQLKNSDVLPVMVTGDSALTGLNAAMKLGIIDDTYGKIAISELSTNQMGSEYVKWRCIESKDLIADSKIYSRNSEFGNLVLTGDCFNVLLKEHNSSVFFFETSRESKKINELDVEASSSLLEGKTKIDHIINRVGVYARMSPNNKVEVVSLFMKRGVITGMVGDGGNDCGALRISHVGLSFSKGDASLVAPFNSSTSNLNSMLEIIREGRSSLASAMSILLYLITYGIMTSLSDTLLTHFAYAAVPDISSSFVAFFAQTLLLIGLLFNSPCRRLAAARPFGSIASIRFVLAFLAPITTYIVGYFIMFNRLSSKPWFQSSKGFNIQLPAQNWFMRMDNIESACSWIYTAVQIIATALCYTMGSQFRNPFYKNPFILVPIVINAIVYGTLIFTGPNGFTCMFRVNCDSVNIQNTVIKLFGITVINPSSRPFSGPNGSSIMPFSWRIEFVIICIFTMLFTVSLFSIITKHKEERRTSVERQF